jgi:hypothetical protein
MPTVAHLVYGITLLPLIHKDAIVHMNAVTLMLGDIGCIYPHLLNGDNLCLAGAESNCYHTCGYQIDDHPHNCVSFSVVGHKCNSLGVFKITLPVNIDDDSFLDSLPDVLIDLLRPESRVCNLAYLGIHATQDAAFGVFSRIAGMDADA